MIAAKAEVVISSATVGADNQFWSCKPGIGATEVVCLAPMASDGRSQRGNSHRGLAAPKDVTGRLAGAAAVQASLV